MSVRARVVTEYLSCCCFEETKCINGERKEERVKQVRALECVNERGAGEVGDCRIEVNKGDKSCVKKPT